MVHVDSFFDDWKLVFSGAGYSEEVAMEEFQTWCEGLDGECDNEYTQNALSVISAAEEAVQELQETQ